MSLDLIQWHHPFWGMFQVQCAVYTLCFIVLAAASMLKTGNMDIFVKCFHKSRGVLAASVIVTVVANLLSATVFSMKTPLPLVLLESAGVLALSIAGLAMAFSPYFDSPVSVSNMKPKEINN